MRLQLNFSILILVFFVTPNLNLIVMDDELISEFSTTSIDDLTPAESVTTEMNSQDQAPKEVLKELRGRLYLLYYLLQDLDRFRMMNGTL